MTEYRNAAPVNAETVKALMDERDRLRAELEAARAENERLTAELAAEKERAEAENEIWKQVFREIVSKDGCPFISCGIPRCGSGECLKHNYEYAKEVVKKIKAKKGAGDCPCTGG